MVQEISKLEIAELDPSTLRLEISGDWKVGGGLPSSSEIENYLVSKARIRRLVLQADRLADWDSALLVFLLKVEECCAAREVEVDRGHLPEGIAKLIRLARAVPERKGARRREVQAGLLERVGVATINAVKSSNESISFIGECSLSFLRMIRGKARFRHSDLLLVIQECGPRAIGIVTLISFLVGVILAFVGSVQLKQFGAGIFVADLVGIAMAREMGALMTAIVLAGRTGAAFAAELGTMQVNEEIDALSTLGIPPVDFLVLPRMLALVIMTPLLCLYADLVGILGGALVGVTLLDLSPVEYFNETLGAITPLDFGVGLIKAVVFGALIAIAGCLKGMQCGRSSAAVGRATTSAVVTSLVLIIVVDGIFSVLFEAIGV